MADAAAHGAPHGAGLNSRRRPARDDDGPFHATFSLGRIAGVQVGANWSWVIVVWLVVWSLAAEVFPDEAPGLSDGAYLAMAGAATLAFFASLLLHELGHAVWPAVRGWRSRASPSGSSAAWPASRACSRRPAPSSASRSPDPPSAWPLGWASSPRGLCRCPIRWTAS